MEISVFGDLHYSFNHQEVIDFEVYREEFYDSFVDFLYSRESDYYISLGDITNSGASYEFEGIFKKLRNHKLADRFQLVLGNHDTMTLAKEEILRHTNLPRYCSLTDEDVALILLDSSLNGAVGGFIDDIQMEWLRNKLVEYKDMTIVILVHHPIYNTTHLSTVDRAYIEQSEELLNLLMTHPQKGFYINGHKHADSIIERDNWTFIQVAAVLDQPNIREIKISNNQFEMKAFQVDPHTEQLAHWLGSKMKHYRLVPYGYRGQDNRNITINY